MKLEHFMLNAMAGVKLTKMGMDTKESSAALDIVIDLHKQIKIIEMLDMLFKKMMTFKVILI